MLGTIHSPGNLGSIIRTSEAVGGAGLICLDQETDPYDPASVRATMGAIFSQEFVRAGPAEFARWKARNGIQVIGTSPGAERTYREVGYSRRAAIFMGSERRGMSDIEARLCDAVVRIPMVGRTDSLNVAVATGVMLYELFGQQYGHGIPGGSTNSPPAASCPAD